MTEPTVIPHCAIEADLSKSSRRHRLESVFGKRAVFSNVRIPGAKGKDAGEIDTLVLFGNRAIVVQAKSKRLTLEARKGNDNLIRDDFKKSVQDSYGQALACAELWRVRIAL